MSSINLFASYYYMCKATTIFSQENDCNKYTQLIIRMKYNKQKRNIYKILAAFHLKADNTIIKGSNKYK